MTRTTMNRRAFTAAAGASVLASGAAVAQPTPSDPLIARTGAGLVRGVLEAGVRVFKGIPYGASTAGARRFMPPAPPAQWEGVRDAFEYGSQSPQAAVGANAYPMWRSWTRPRTMSEDCLVLNVWTPALRDGGARPVMVWLHGGGFTSFDGSSPAYDGVRLCNRGDVVVVTLNHRLNAFGYLHLGDLAGAAFAQSGNCGQLDIIAALAWVRDTIAEFGGDPNNVTIFGESGGGAKVCTLMAMPGARGLFHRGIVQSGPLLRALPREAATRNAQRILDQLSIPASEAARLQDVPMDALIEAMTQSSSGGGMGAARAFAPVVDGEALPRNPFDPDATPLSADIPLMIGSNAHEMSIFNPDPALLTLTWEDLPQRAAPFLYGGDSAHIIAEFRRLRPNATASEIYQAIASERFMGSGSKLIAERKAAQAAPVYMYYFTWETPVDGGRWGSAHALEIPFVFDNLALSTSFVGEDAPQALADAMSESWIAFARSGDPSHAGVPAWPRYDAARRATMEFGDAVRVVDDPHGEERALIAALPLPPMR